MAKLESRLSLRFTGRGTEPVVFLHGLFGSAADWDPICEALGEDFLTVRVDLPGHGNSVDLLDPALYTMQGCVREITSLVASIGSPRAVLVGYSMGGRVALHAALAAPGQYSGIFLESASPGIESDRARSERLVLDYTRAALLREDPRSFLDSWYEMPMWDSLRRRPDLLARVKAERYAVRPGEVARALEGLGVGACPDRWAELSGIPCPILALAGAADAAYVLIIRRMADQSPRVRSVIVEDSGHNVHMEKPEVYLETLKSFLAACGVS